VKTIRSFIYLGVIIVVIVIGVLSCVRYDIKRVVSGLLMDQRLSR
jgi:hypothetical protein